MTHFDRKSATMANTSRLSRDIITRKNRPVQPDLYAKQPTWNDPDQERAAEVRCLHCQRTSPRISPTV